MTARPNQAESGVTAMREFPEISSPSRNDPYRTDPTACHHCREPFKPDRMRYPILSGVNFGSGWEVVSVCMDCFKYADADECTLADRYKCKCAGCGAPMLIPYHRRFKWRVCSRRCYQRLYRKHRRRYGSTIDWKARSSDWPKCEVCNHPLKAKRDDARFCSNACRQWTYRRRKGAPS